MATVGSIKEAIAALIPNNTGQQITPTDVRDSFNTLLDGYVIPQTADIKALADQATAAALQARYLTTVVFEGTSLVINASNKSTYEGAYIRFTSNSAVLIAFGRDITGSFFCCPSQSGGGRVTIQATQGATMINDQNLFKTRGQGSIASVVLNSNVDNNSAIYFLNGALAI